MSTFLIEYGHESTNAVKQNREKEGNISSKQVNVYVKSSKILVWFYIWNIITETLVDFLME